MKPKDLVRKFMYDQDAFSKQLGITIISIDKGMATLSLVVTKTHTNGFDVVHGGVLYSLADTAIAFASGGYGKIGLTIEGNINYLKAAKTDDTLTAIAIEISRSKKLAVYQCDIHNQEGIKVAYCKGTIYLKDIDLA